MRSDCSCDSQMMEREGLEVAEEIKYGSNKLHGRFNWPSNMSELTCGLSTMLVSTHKIILEITEET